MIEVMVPMKVALFVVHVLIVPMKGASYRHWNYYNMHYKDSYLHRNHYFYHTRVQKNVNNHDARGINQKTDTNS